MIAAYTAVEYALASGVSPLPRIGFAVSVLRGRWFGPAEQVFHSASRPEGELLSHIGEIVKGDDHPCFAAEQTHEAFDAISRL